MPRLVRGIHVKPPHGACEQSPIAPPRSVILRKAWHSRRQRARKPDRRGLVRTIARVSASRGRKTAHVGDATDLYGGAGGRYGRAARSEERGEGKEGVGTCRER